MRAQSKQLRWHSSRSAHRFYEFVIGCEHDKENAQFPWSRVTTESTCTVTVNQIMAEDKRRASKLNGKNVWKRQPGHFLPSNLPPHVDVMGDKCAYCLERTDTNGKYPVHYLKLVARLYRKMSPLFHAVTQSLKPCSRKKMLVMVGVFRNRLWRESLRRKKHGSDRSREGAYCSRYWGTCGSHYISFHMVDMV